jgi:hypothetical protein
MLAWRFLRRRRDGAQRAIEPEAAGVSVRADVASVRYRLLDTTSPELFPAKAPSSRATALPQEASATPARA